MKFIIRKNCFQIIFCHGINEVYNTHRMEQEIREKKKNEKQKKKKKKKMQKKEARIADTFKRKTQKRRDCR